MHDKPNVVFLFSDQHRRDAAGCYGHPVVQTPNIDRLAAEGVRFTHAYAAAPICHPGRSALMTGRPVHRCCDLTSPEQRLDLSLPNLGTTFRQAGYVTAAFGKVHVPGEDGDHDLGFDERAMRIYTPMSNDYQHTIGLENFWKYCSYLPQYRPHPGAQPRHSYNLRNEPIALEEALIFDRLVADRAIAFMKKVSGDRKGGRACRSFFLWVGLEKPHPELYAPKRFHDLYDPGAMVLPDNRHFDRSHLPDSIYDNPTVPIADGLTDDEMRGAMAAYFANVSYMDEQLGRIVDAIDTLGLAQDTLVVYSADHGENLFSHGLVHKHCFFEEAVGVPLILRIPGTTRPGSVSSALVTLVDLLPTLCEACGLPVPEGVEGRSLLPAITAGTMVHEAVFSEYYSAGIPERMIRTGRWKYVHSHGDRHQLYDLDRDPHENINRIDDPACAAVAAELERQVTREWVLPDMSRWPRMRGDTRPGQRGCACRKVTWSSVSTSRL